MKSGLNEGGHDFRAVVLGASAGGSEAFAGILSTLPADFALPILAVQHLHPMDDGQFASHLGSVSRLTVATPRDKRRIDRGRVYVAPSNYHVLVERDGSIALSVDEKVNWSRLSIDVLFESPAQTWADSLIAVILSDASADGAKGTRAVKEAGGLTIVQDPASAEYPVMPQAAIDAGAVDEVLTLEEIGPRLAKLGTLSNTELGSRDGERNMNDERIRNSELRARSERKD
ncbi:MAG: chemotaxis protein CheB [Acidobacteriota bacterium]